MCLEAIKGVWASSCTFYFPHRSKTTLYMIAIIGAGISGLSLAYFLQKNQQDYVLLEASDRVGGYIQTIQEGNYLFEVGPNSILADPQTLQWIQEWGLAEALLPAAAVSQHRYIYRRGRYRKLPSGPKDLLWNNFFSWKTKYQLWRETKQPVKNIPNETLSSFFSRRFGQEIVEYALAPFVAGIYAGDPDKLLVAQTFPQLKAYEQQYGSVIKGFRKNKSTGRKHSYSFQNGMQALPQGIAQHLRHIKYHSPVLAINRTGTHYQLQTPEGILEARQVVLATPAPVAAKLLADLAPQASEAVAKINYPPMAAVHLVYDRSAVKHPLDGFGGLNPRREQRFAAGSIWASSIFSNKCPQDQVLLTNFVGGSQAATHYALDDETIFDKVAHELAEAYQIVAPPKHRQIYRWPQAIPQYDQAQAEAEQAILPLSHQELYICANWKGGVSLPDCIKKGHDLAQLLTQINCSVC
jgi:oxygen-dependent protoporphyrinogen oxidase